MLATALAGETMFYRTEGGELFPVENFWVKINMRWLPCLSFPPGMSSLLPVGLHARQASYECGPAQGCQCPERILRFLEFILEVSCVVFEYGF